MKVKQLLKIKECVEDKKLPCDMYELYDTKYMSVSRDEMIPISEMDIIHLIRAFKNDRHKLANQLTDMDMVRQNDELVNANKNLGDRVDYLTKGIQDGFISGVADLEKIEQLEKDNSELKFQIQQVDRNQTVSKEAYDIAWQNMEYYKKKYTEVKDENNTVMDRNVVLSRMYNATLSNPTKGCGYVFSDIPNDCDGQRFTDDMKQYLNKDSYKLRVRGQYLKDEVKDNEGWRKYERGQPIAMSKCLRVYLDKK